MPKGKSRPAKKSVAVPRKEKEHSRSLLHAQTQIARRARPIDLRDNRRDKCRSLDEVHSPEQFYDQLQDWAWRAIATCDRYLESIAESIAKMLRKKPNAVANLSSFSDCRVEFLCVQIGKSLADFNAVVEQWNDGWRIGVDKLTSIHAGCFALRHLIYPNDHNKAYETMVSSLDSLEKTASVIGECQMFLDILISSKLMQYESLQFIESKYNSLPLQYFSYVGLTTDSEIQTILQNLKQWKVALDIDINIVSSVFFQLVDNWNNALRCCDQEGVFSSMQSAPLTEFVNEKHDWLETGLDKLWKENENLDYGTAIVISLELKLKKHIEAATAIQAWQRGGAAQARLLREARQNYRPNAATTIQRWWRRKRGTSIRPTLPKPIRPVHARVTQAQNARPRPKPAPPPRRRVVPLQTSTSSASRTAAATQCEVCWGDERDGFWQVCAKIYAAPKTKDAMNHYVSRVQQARRTDRSTLPPEVQKEIPASAVVYHRTTPGHFTLFFYQTTEFRGGRAVQKLVVFGMGHHKTGHSATYRVDFWMRGGLKMTKCRVTLN